MNAPRNFFRPETTQEHSEFFHENLRAFEELIESDYIKGIIRNRKKSFGIDDVTMEDLVQDVYMRIMAKMDEKPIDNMGQFFAFALRNRCVDYLRRARNNTQHRELNPNLEKAPDKKPDVLLQNSIEAALSCITETRRVAFILFLQGLSGKEISKLLGIPLGTTNTRVYHAKKSLREKLSTVAKDYNIHAA